MGIRPATAGDRDLLAEATLGNLNWNGPRFTLADVHENPHFRRYWDPWPGPADLGLVAEAGQPVGVAWLKHFTADERGYGFVEPGIPELSVHVVATYRGRGVGGRLLAALIDEARFQALPGISLSVEEGNPALRLYLRLGFHPAAGAEPGTYVLTL